MPAPPSILAIIAARNEADIIGQTVRDLIDQGVDVYLIDDNSTDGTADSVRPWLGNGVRGIETLDRDPTDRFSLSRILARKEELARTFEADWYINHDADELRESPIGGLSFAQAIGLVDRLGFNAIDFAVFNFFPIDETFASDADLRSSFQYYEPGGAFDRTQIRCWKRQPDIDLQASAGHDVAFAGRRVFPIRFILRHYPVRTSVQGRRKIFHERLPRFDPAEVERGWHVQYNAMQPEAPLLKPASALFRFDLDAIRVSLSLQHRDVEALHASQKQEVDRLAAELVAAGERTAQERQARTEVEQVKQRLDDEVAAIARERDALQCERSALQREGDALQRDHDAVVRERVALERDVAAAAEAVRSLKTELAQAHANVAHVANDLARIESSRTWRWTAPFRRVAGWFGIR